MRASPPSIRTLVVSAAALALCSACKTSTSTATAAPPSGTATDVEAHASGTVSAVATALGLEPAKPHADSPDGNDAFGIPLPHGALARLGTDMLGVHEFPALAFSPDGRQLFVGGMRGGPVTLWDSAPLRPRRRIASGDPVVKVKVAPDDAIVFVAGAHRLRAIDVASSVERWSMDVPATTTTGDTQLSRDGRRLVWSSADGQSLVRNVDAESGAVREVPGTKGVRGAAYNSDGTRLATLRAGSGVVYVIDADSGAPIYQVDTKEPSLDVVAWSQNGRYLAAGGAAGSVLLFDASDGTPLKTVSSNAGGVHAIAFSPDSTRVAAQQGSEVRVWEIASGASIFHAHAAMGAHEIAFSADSRQLAFWDDGDSLRADDVRIGDFASGTLTARLEMHDGAVGSLLFTDDGLRLLSGAADGTARLWDLHDGTSKGTIADGPRAVSSPGDQVAIAVSRDPSTIAVGTRDGNVRLYPAKGGAPSKTFAVPGTTKAAPWIRSLAFTPDGKRLVAAPSTGPVVLLDAASGRKMRTFGGRGDIATSVAISPDGTLVATAYEGKPATLWRTGSGARLRILTASNGLTGDPAIAFSPDGRHVALSTKTGLGIWSTSNGRREKQLDAQGMVGAFAWSPDSQELGYSTGAGNARLFRVRDGKTRALPIDDVTSIAFSRDGTRYATGQRDGTIVVWARQATPGGDFAD